MTDSIKDGLPDIYNNSWEHLRDELKLLDLMLERQVFLCRESGSHFPGDSLRSLTISETEIIQLLAASKETSHTDLSRVQQLSRQIEQLDSEIRRRFRLTRELGKYLSLQRLIDIFKLNEFETRVLVIALAPELDFKYEKIYGFLQDDLSRKKPGIQLVLNLLCPTTDEKWLSRLAFEATAPLVRYLIELFHYPGDAPPTLIRQCIKLEHRIVNFLLEYNQVDDRIHNWVELKSWESPKLPDGECRALSQRIKHLLQQLHKSVPDRTAKVIFCFNGPRGVGKKYQVQQICQQLGVPVLIADIRRMLRAGRVGNENIRLVGREAVLQQAALCFDNFDLLADEHGNYSSIDLSELDKSILNFGLPLFLLGQDVIHIDNASNYVVIQMELTPPDIIQRKKLWQTMAAGLPANPNCNWDELAGKFHFTPGQICRSLATAQTQALWRGLDNAQIEPADIYRACHESAGPALKRLATKVNPRYTCEQLILPPDQTEQLQSICIQAKYRYLVYGKWGFDRMLSYGKGLNVLFFGAPGTGKTMAAEILAGELQQELYKVDLSRVVSKYIGETEKNLSRIFDEAESSSAILFFDEADALFGKRSEIKDAHDRYANVEIGYLLQRMESYTGIVILATNLSKNLDEAFLRRMQFTVEFPFPDTSQRERIWKTVFPEKAPLSPDINYVFLAEKMKVSGGNIKNIAINAAFNAAKANTEIGMVHIMKAGKREYQKMGKAFLKTDFQPYYEWAEGSE